MFKLIQQYELVGLDRVWYRPRAFGDRQADGTWDGWLVFFPIAGGPAIASDRETTQSTFAALTRWSTGLTPVYLEGALDRAFLKVYWLAHAVALSTFVQGHAEPQFQPRHKVWCIRLTTPC